MACSLLAASIGLRAADEYSNFAKTTIANAKPSAQFLIEWIAIADARRPADL
jgi:hypothetical protein